MRKILGIGLAAAGMLTIGLVGAPATAATLPATDRVYILPCDFDALDGLLYQVDTVTGEVTRVGDWVNPDDTVFSCAGPGAYNPVDGLGYWIAWDGSESYLHSVDLATGVNTLIGQFSLEDEPYYTPIAVAIDSDGNAWATSWSSSPDVLFSLDLTTAVLTEVGPTGITPDSNNYGLAWDPVTETVYGYNASGSDFYTVNTETGAFSLFNDDVLGAVGPYAIAFDSAGQVWGIDQDIISAPLADLDDSEVLPVINPYPAELDATGNIYSESIIIARAPAAGPEPEPEPEPELAATGADSGIAGIAGALLLVSGIALIRPRAPRAQ